MRNRPLPSPDPVRAATQAKVERFLKGLQRFRAKGIAKDTPFDEAEVRKYDEVGVKAFLDKMTAGSQQAVARRIMEDIMKAPTRGVSGRPARKPTKKRKSSSKAKAKRLPKKSKAPKRPAVKKKKASRHRRGGR